MYADYITKAFRKKKKKKNNNNNNNNNTIICDLMDVVQ